MRSRLPKVSLTAFSNSNLAAGHRSEFATSRTATGGMAQPRFFEQPPSSTLATIAALTKARLVDPSRGGQQVRGLASLDEAGPMHLTFFDNLKYASQLASTKAGACLVSERFEASVPAHVAVLRARHPFREFVKVARELHGDALRPQSWCGQAGIAASAVIGANVRIGRDCSVGAQCAIQFALVGNDVLIHPGCSIGQDGYGFVFFGPDGHLKVPQTGRVLIQNDVEIGAGTTIDRGRLRDTVIGEGTKIDNQVQIGHNVIIGRHCLLAAQIGLAGSLTIGDNVALGAKVGINNHLKIGDGAQVTAMSAVKDDIPPNGRWGGHFAKPTKQWFREIVAVERLVQGGAANTQSTSSKPKGEGHD